MKLITTQDFYSLVGKIVTFSEKIEETECDFDPGMKARVSGVELKDHDLIKVFFNFEEFLDHNRKFMKPNYYDKDGNTTLKWEETAFFPKNFISEDYFSLDFEDNMQYFSEITEDKPYTKEEVINLLRDLGMKLHQKNPKCIHTDWNNIVYILEKEMENL